MTTTSPHLPGARPAWHRWAALAILLVAVGTRFHGLADQSFWLDELHSLEGACGHGVEHEAIPTGRLVTAPPDLTRLAAARPIWTLWTSLDWISHPPGSYLLLRAWIDVFGESEAAVRSLSAVTSTAAVVVLFLAVRPWGGSEPALWAAALMAVAGPQVHAAHDGRPYAPIMLLGTLALWGVGRTVRLGPTRRRAFALTAILLALLLMHYFTIAAVAVVGTYGLLFTCGPTRRQLVGATMVAGGVFAIVWGPLMWRQVAAFSPADRDAAFLSEPGPGHAAHTAWRALTLPASLMVDARPIPLVYGLVGGLVYVAAVALCLRRRWPAVWPLWYAGTVALLAALDLARSTRHLDYIRYPLLTAPVVYVAVGLLPTLHRPLGRLLAAAAVAFAAWSLPAADVPANEDFRSLGDAVAASVPPGQPIVFAGPASRYGPQILYLAVSHYAGVPAGPVVLQEAPAAPPVLRQLPSTVWMVADPEVRLAREWLPGYRLAAGQSWPVVGSLLRMEREQGEREKGIGAGGGGNAESRARIKGTAE